MKTSPGLETDFMDNLPAPRIDRREFLKLGGGVFILFSVGDFSTFAEAQQSQRGLPTDFNAFLRIGEDGRVSCYTGKIEMGQGVNTSLAQMLADELDVQLDVVDMVMGDTDLCPYDRGTFGSQTTRSFGQALRAAGAEAKRVLVELASEQLKLSVETLGTENGSVFDKSNRNNRVPYARLTQGKRIERHLSQAAIRKMPSEFRVMNKPVNRRDAEDKVTGKARYSADIQLPGMLYARILRPPAHGAKLTGVDLSSARKISDVVVIQEGDFVAVLHQYPDVAEQALSAIQATFSTPLSVVNDTTIFDHLLSVAGPGQVVSKEGDLPTGERASKSVIERTYRDGYKAHAPMEPHTAVANLEGSKMTVWASTQTPFPLKDEIVRGLGFSPENVRIITPYLGGGFGGKSRNLQAVEAARLAKLTGKPVQVAWTRQEEFFYDAFRPAAIVKIRSGITGNGSIAFWDYSVYFAGQRGSQHFYTIPHYSTRSFEAEPGKSAHPFATGPWRAPANNTNTFARESQIDIMAAEAGCDPLEFRLQHLPEGNIKSVLKAAGEKFGWKPAKGPSGRGYGIACGTDAGTFVATIAEVAVDKRTGDVRVQRVVCAQDMGLVINPAGASIQMEGCIMMGLGYALKEDVRFKNGEILNENFDTYEIPRFSWLPKIETVLMDNKGADPQGGGEPAIITMGGAIANAIFDAIGARVFQLPMTPERIKEALAKK
ncbi:MAG: xanthine dehydrogenase family protein molybdopterin-binding subunit [Ignavibacteriales bacterium]|nr:xanthine dehydrogenase family protein molybdopterin-binding subunit [Ignavibacteriales bacterium]